MNVSSPKQPTNERRAHASHPHQSFTPNLRLFRPCVSLLFAWEATGGWAPGCNPSQTRQSLISLYIYFIFQLKEMFFFSSLKNPEGSGWTECLSSQRGAVIAGLVINGPAAESNETQTHPRGSQQLDAAPAAPRLGELAFMPA